MGARAPPLAFDGSLREVKMILGFWGSWLDNLRQPRNKSPAAAASDQLYGTLYWVAFCCTATAYRLYGTSPGAQCLKVHVKPKPVLAAIQ